MFSSTFQDSLEGMTARCPVGYGYPDLHLNGSIVSTVQNQVFLLTISPTIFPELGLSNPVDRISICFHPQPKVPIDSSPLSSKPSGLWARHFSSLISRVSVSPGYPLCWANYLDLATLHRFVSPFTVNVNLSIGLPVMANESTR